MGMMNHRAFVLQNRFCTLKKLFFLGLVAVSLVSCSGRNARPVTTHEEELPAQTLPERVGDTVDASPAIEETPVKPAPSAPANSTSTSTEKKTMTEPDNMRGFDPASEDDMDDNGMSRYMENNDEEGWD
jgi:hypothetical protein